MKTKMKYLLFAGGLMLMVSCGNKNEAEKNDADSPDVEVNVEDDKNDDLEAEFTILREEYDQRIEANKEKIRELRDAKREGKKEIDAAYEARIDELEERNEELRRRLNEYEGTDKSGWERFKEEFRHDMNQLGESIEGLFEDKDEK